MIQRLSHVTIWVLNQDRAKAFYTEKLGFEVRNDTKLEGFRWLTVGPPAQPELELILMPMDVAPPHMDEATSSTMKALVRNGKLGPGVFATADCRKTYEELKARGVEFMNPPTERPYGIEALMKDDSGNWFSLVQPRG